MTYEQAMGATVSRQEAAVEIARHPTGGHAGEDWDIFLAEVGDKVEYTGAEVLDWLGY